MGSYFKALVEKAWLEEVLRWSQNHAFSCDFPESKNTDFGF